MKKIIRTPSKHFIYILFVVFGLFTSFKGSAQVTIPSVIINSCTGSITILADGGSTPYVYEWYKENTSGDWVLLTGEDYYVLNNQAPGTYKVLVTDANDDSVEGVYDISEPVDLYVKEVLTGLVCKEDPNSGVIILRFENGVPPYTWTLKDEDASLIDNGEVDPTDTPYYLSIDNIPVGDYTFDWTDDFGCSGTEEITVSAPPKTELTINATTGVVCFGDSNGEVNISVTGGWGPDYAINIVPDGGVPEPIESFTNIGDGTNYTINELAAGTYQIYYYDKLANPPLTTTYGLDVSNYNCAKFKTFTIDTPAELISTPTGELLSCFGDADGNITGTITGGTAPYTIELDNTTQITVDADGGNFDFSGLSVGNYNFTTTDAVGCIDTKQASITQPDQLITEFVSKQDVSCNAGTDGNIIVSVTGGTAGYIFTFDDGTEVTPTLVSDDNYTIGNLSAGTYNITITDQNTCTASKVIEQTITEPSSLTVATSGETLTCFGDSDGNITGSISGGTAPYTISLDGTATQITVDNDGGSFDFSGLSAETYTFTITDAKDCTTTVQETIDTPAELISTPAGELLSCFGDTDGNITGTITGGTAPYTIKLVETGSEQTGIADGGSFNFSGLSADTYNFTITDAADCFINTQASITQPDQLITSFVSKQDVSCNAGTDGNIIVSVTGGTAGYIFKVDGTEVTPTLASGINYTIGDLSAGTYNITITDQNDCTATNSVTQEITEPAEISLSLDSFQNLSCFNSGNGSITVGVTGGTLSTTLGAPNYIFTLTGPSAVIAQDNGGGTWTFGSLDEGTYTISVTDQNNCISNPVEITQKLTQPLAINFTASEQDISCNGAEDGSIDITVTGGTIPYTYAWTGPNGFSEATKDISALAPGAYTIEVTDDNECTLAENYIITEPDVLGVSGDLSDYNGFGVSGNGEEDGSIDITVTGGTTPHSYSWTSSDGIIPSGQETQEDLTGLNAGTYTVQITDTNGCTTTKTWEITEPNELLIIEQTGSHVDVLCFGENTGVIEVVVNQGSVAPYTYTITDNSGVEVEQVTVPEGNYVFDELLADTYTVTVTDANGISKSINNITITQPASLLEISSEIISDFNGYGISCNGAADGSIAINNVSGGEGAYTYAWTGPNSFSEITKDISALAPGAYTLVVTDDNGCTAEETYTITEPDVLGVSGDLSDYNGFEVSGNGLSDGSIDITVTGGTAPHSYSWTSSDGTIPVGQDTQEDLTGLNAGTYTVQITDTNGCTITDSWTITEPNDLVISEETASHVDVLCFGENTGVIEVVVDQGSVAPYDYKITNSLGVEVEVEQVTDPTVVSYVFNELLADTYTATVTDANGISKSINNIIITEPASLLEISSEIISDFNGYGISCNGAADGSIAITISGGEGAYTYSWTGPNFSAITKDISALAPGAYTITVTDDNGCTAEETYTITEPDVLVLEGILSNYNGFGVSGNGLSDGSIDITVTGGAPPHTYSWTSSDEIIPSGQETQEDLTGLNAGTYTVQITDTNGCTITDTWIITEPQELLISEETASHVDVLCFGENTGVIEVVVDQESVAPYEYTITDSSGVEVERVTDQNAVSYVFDELLADTYTVTVTDANGISKSINNITITQPTSLLEISSEIISDFNGYGISCNGAADGSIDITVSGGTTPYSYAWTSPNGFNETTQNISALAPGAYSITVTDANGCSTAPETYTITEPDVLGLAGDLSDYNGFGVSGNGLSDGSIDITVTGGTAPHSYSWTSSDGTIPVGQDTQEDLTGLNAGTYTVQITDTNGCTITDTWIIMEPQELVISEETASHVDVLCFGENTGVIEVVVDQGSVAPYDYKITNSLGVVVEQVNAQTALNYVFDALFADTYTVTVTDANGISKSINNIIITQPLSLLRISSEIISDFNGYGISCNGAADGSIDITVSGGTTPYSYAWTGPNGFSETSQDVNALAPGAYTLVVTDDNACTAEETYTITEPDEIIINTTLLQDVQCFENSDGKIEITITGGTGDFTYNWTKNSTPYATTKDLAGLSPGEYVLIVQEDGNSQCYRTKTFTITQPDLLEIAFESKTDILCYGDSTGSAQISVTGGTSPYQYSWIEASGATYNTEDLVGVPAGDYQLTIIDALGCSDTFNVILNEPDNIVLNESKTDITCFGSNDGTISIAVTGGVSPYTYVWSDLGSGPLRRDLSPGIYDVTVTDSNNCQKMVQFEIIEAPLFKIDPITTHISCFGATDGSIDLNLVGGIAPLNITWGDGNSAGLIRNNLSAGSYSVFIEDAVGCSIAKNFSIIEPSEIVLDAVVMNAIDCTDPNSGSIDLQVVGGTAPFIFLWSTGSTTEDLQNIGANNYTVTVTDSRGCEEQKTVVVTRQTPLVLNLNTSIIPDCINKTVIQRNELEVLGGVAPYNISWSNGMISGANDEIMETTQNGSVIVEVTDSLGCTEQLVLDINLFTLGDPRFNNDSFANSNFGILSIDDPITFINTSSGDPLSFLWSFGDGNTSTDKDPSHTYTTEGTYEVILTVQYPYGCSFTETMTINIGKGYNIVIPNAFTPNSDGLNDVIRPVYIGMNDVEMSIYNKWGALVYFEKGLELKGWDGVIKNNLGENGNYIIKVKATTFYGLVLRFNKPITLIK